MNTQGTVWTAELVEKILAIDNIFNVTSLDAVVASNDDDKDGSDMYTFVEDTETPSPEEVAIKNDIKTKVKEAIQRLKPQQIKVLTMRFGIENDREMTLDEIGKTMNLTRERVRQIEVTALRKMRIYLTVNHAYEEWKDQ